MTTPAPASNSADTYQPTLSQLERAARLRRFNWLTLYGPVLLIGAAVLGLVGLMLWGAFSPAVAGTAEFVSGLADLIVILAIIPWLMVCGLIPAAIIALFIYRARRPNNNEHGRLRLWIWQLDAFIDKTRGKIDKLLPQAVKPVIEINVRLRFWRVVADNLMRMLRRS